MSTSVHARFILFVCSLGLIVLAAACGSTSKTSTSSNTSDARPAKTGRPLRVRYIAYKQQKKLELVNESHSDRTEMYSTTKKLEEAFVKVTPDEVLDETLAIFKQNGFDERATPGSAPPASDALLNALEVEQDGRSRFLALSTASQPDDVRRFEDCRKLFFAVYSNTYQLQSVDRAPDWDSQNSQLKKPRKQ